MRRNYSAYEINSYNSVTYRTIPDPIVSLIDEVRQRAKTYVDAIDYLKKHKIWVPQQAELTKQAKILDSIIKDLKVKK